MNFLRKLPWFRQELRSCHPGILCEQLEERIVLDAAPVDSDQNDTQNTQSQTALQADTGATPDAPQAGGINPSSSPETPDTLAQVFANDLNVVIVSNALDDIQSISDAATEGTALLFVDPVADDLATVNQQLHDLVADTGQKIGALAVLSHGSEGLLTIGSDEISMFTLSTYSAGLGELGTYLSADAQIQLYGCSIAGNALGTTFVNTMASYTGAHVFASTDPTGGPAKDWNLEYASDAAVAIIPILDSAKAADLETTLAAPYPGYDDNWGQALNGAMYYVSDEDGHGKELWRSDGTAAGTYIVKDINPGPVGSDPSELVVSNGVLYFAATDGASADGTELWRSDGTEAGTYMVKDINPGNLSSNPNSLADVNGILYFGASDGAAANGTELWRSDGTAAGTYLVKDINLGSSSSNPANLVNVNGTLFFSATEGSNGVELWRSDGTDPGTYMVADIRSGNPSSNPANLVNVNGTLFFSASNGANGNELWSSDGTGPGTLMVKDINTGGPSSDPAHLVDVNGILYFSASDGASNHGNELWSSDGTELGTNLVKDVRPGNLSSDPEYIVNVNGTVFFAADDGTHGYELWKSDGTDSGTVMLKDAAPGTDGSRPMFLNDYDGDLLYVADDGTHGYELWTSDGTEAGTVLMKDINPSGASFPLNFARLNPLFFLADDGAGYKLWKTDGTVSGTVKVSEVHPIADGNPPQSGGTAGGSPDLDQIARSFGDTHGNSLLDIIASERMRSADTSLAYDPSSPSSDTGGSSGGAKDFFQQDARKFRSLSAVADSETDNVGPAGGVHKDVSDSDDDRQSGKRGDPDSEAVEHRPNPGTIKVLVLNNGDYSVHTDGFALVVGHQLWIPPIVKWYLAAVSEGRYRPGTLPHGYEDMIWDFLRYSSSRQTGGEAPVQDLELRLAWQWAEWRRQIAKDRGTDESLPWSFFRGLSEAMILFYGQMSGGKVDFSGAVKTLHHNASSLCIIPVNLPDEFARLQTKEPVVK